MRLLLRRTLLLKNNFQLQAVSFREYNLLLLLKADCRLLNTALNVQECDASGDASYSIAGFKIIVFKILFNIFSGLQISATKI